MQCNCTVPAVIISLCEIVGVEWFFSIQFFRLNFVIHFLVTFYIWFQLNYNFLFYSSLIFIKKNQHSPHTHTLHKRNNILKCALQKGPAIYPKFNLHPAPAFYWAGCRLEMGKVQGQNSPLHTQTCILPTLHPAPCTCIIHPPMREWE